MFVPFFAWPLAAQLIVAADTVPKIDVTPSCRGAAQAGYIATTAERLKSCIESENRTRDQLVKDWGTFAVADRTWCVSSIAGFQPTYSELATCLEMKRDIKKMQPADSTSPAASPATPTRNRAR